MREERRRDRQSVCERENIEFLVAPGPRFEVEQKTSSF